MDREEDSDKKTSEETKDTSSFEVLPKPSKLHSKNTHGTRVADLDFSKIPDSKKLSKVLALIVVVILIGFGAGWLGSSVENNGNTLGNTSAKEIVSSKDQLTSAIATNASQSVVSVVAQGTATSQDIFGNLVPSQQQSEGTGIIISSSGYILTNRHVVPAGTSSVSVVLADGTTINNVQIIGETGSSDSLDVAILKINNPPEQLQPALLGDSSKVQIGDEVVAIGNALGQFQNTVTSGIISGRGRSIQAGDSGATTSEDLQDLFQTDAAINEGNSGGPLININGEVIGLNTAIASSAQNIGFSIPINDVEGIVKGVFATGKLERPYLGVYYVSINPSVQKQYGISASSGAYIPSNQQGQPSILPNSPASNAGLQVGDVITAVNGTKIDNNNSLSSLIDENQVGTKVTLTVIRSGSTKSIGITVGNEPTQN